MKKIIISVAILILSLPLNAQDISIDDAIETMKETSALFLKGQYTRIDATGIDQYVDVEIKRVYEFSDFSFGAILPLLKKYLEIEISISDRPKIREETKRIIEYATEDLTKIVAYAAKVDYEGVTKYHEKIPFTRLFFFDWKGRLIAIRSDDYNRQDYAEQLPALMEKRIQRELRAQCDPLFPPFDRWVSETGFSSDGSRDYEMIWCYDLFKNCRNNDNVQRGEFEAIYYQVQKGFALSKSATFITGQYILDNGEIEFTYNTANVKLYFIDPEYVDKFEPLPDFSNINKRIMHYSPLNTNNFKKVIRKGNNVPLTFSQESENIITMSVPIQDAVYKFHKQIED